MSMKTIFFYANNCTFYLIVFAIDAKNFNGNSNFENSEVYTNQWADTSALENPKGKNFTEVNGVYEVPNNGKITLLSLILLPMPLVWKPIQIPLYISLKNFPFPLTKLFLVIILNNNQTPQTVE